MTICDSSKRCFIYVFIRRSIIELFCSSIVFYPFIYKKSISIQITDFSKFQKFNSTCSCINVYFDFECVCASSVCCLHLLKNVNNFKIKI